MEVLQLEQYKLSIYVLHTIAHICTNTCQDGTSTGTLAKWQGAPIGNSYIASLLLLVKSYVAKSINCLIIGARPMHNDTSEECSPKCRLGQCCVDGKCLCIDSEAMEVADCECVLNYHVVM